MIANDSLVQQGGFLMQKVRRDAIADPESINATGGTGASSELDDVRLQQLVVALAKNIEKVKSLLEDPSVFPPNRPLDDRLARVQAGLRDVLDAQRTELNALGGTVDTNEAADLQSRRDPISEVENGGSLRYPVAKRVSYVEALHQAMDAEGVAETKVTPEIDVLVQACR
jgi:hypothetical protein